MAAALSFQPFQVMPDESLWSAYSSELPKEMGRNSGTFYCFANKPANGIKTASFR
jgi:hypothetical protein